MRRFLRVFILLCAIVSIYPSVAVTQVPIAVLDFEPKGVAEIEASALTDRFRDELFILGQKSGKYRVMERGLMEDIMEEQNFQLSGCTSNECAVEVGKIIGVQQIIGGSISKVGDVYSISARIISVETGEVLQVATYDYQGNIGALMTQGMGEVVRKLINIEPGEAVSAGNTRGILYIESSPDSADVWIDDNKIEGSTPVLAEDQPAGNRHVVVKKGTYTAETTLHLAPGELKKIHLDLVSTVGNLRIVTTPAEVEAYLDHEHIGQSPVFLKDVSVGSHILTYTLLMCKIRMFSEAEKNHE